MSQVFNSRKDGFKYVCKICKNLNFGHNYYFSTLSNLKRHSKSYHIPEKSNNDDEFFGPQLQPTKVIMGTKDRGRPKKRIRTAGGRPKKI